MTSVIAVKIAAAGSADPYVVIRLSWLAASSRCRGTRLGTLASLAGPQIRLTISISTVATSTQVSVPTIGMLTKNAARIRSPTIIVMRRSSRSATQPATGPITSAGSTRRNSTPPMAKFAAW